MAKLQFKKKCYMCKDVWVLVESKTPTVCDACKRKIKKANPSS